MKKIILALFVLLSGLSYGQTSSGDLRHVVIFKFKETSSKASVDSVVKSFMGLAKKIPVIKSLVKIFGAVIQSPFH